MSARTPDGLFSPWLVVGLALAAGAVMLALKPAADGRSGRARQVSPSSLSLSLLRLEVARHPDDLEARLALVDKLVSAGQLQAARDALSELPAEAASGAAIQALFVDLDRRALFAIAPEDRAGRAAARAALLTRLRSQAPDSLPAARLRELSELSRAIDAAQESARFLRALALRTGAAEDVEAADAALLEAGDPATAARMHSALATRHLQPKQGAPDAGDRTRAPAPANVVAAETHALSALAHAKSTGDVDFVVAIYDELAAHLYEAPRFEAEGLTLLTDVSPARALSLAERRLQRNPNDADAVRTVAVLAGWTGAPGKALRAYAWLARHGGTAEDHRQALALARAQWALPLVEELTRPAADTGHGRALLFERLSLLETLGDVDGAIAEARARLQTDLARDGALWALLVQLQLRAGHARQAEASLSELRARVGLTPDQRALYAGLLMRRGQVAEARVLLDAGGGTLDAGQLRLLGELSLEAGDFEAGHGYYEALAGAFGATAADAHTHIELTRAVHGDARALREALAAHRRLGDASLLGSAIGSALSLADHDTAARLLARAEGDPHFSRDPGYWQLRIGLAHAAASSALSEGRPAEAQAELTRAAQWLALAERAAPSETAYGELRAAQERARLSAALELDDREALSPLYADQAERLSVRERVSVLHRLERDDEALALALRGARDGRLDPDDRAALRADANALASEQPRRTWADAELYDYGPTTMFESRAGVEYSWKPQRGASLSVGYADLATLNRLSTPIAAPHELSATLGVRVDDSRAQVGLSLRDGDAPRPFASLEQSLLGDGESFLSGRVGLHERARDTLALRTRGARDELALSGRLALGQGFYTSSRLAAAGYHTRDRDYRGVGATAEASAGRSFEVFRRAARVDVRALGYAAPRFASAADADDRIVPDGTVFTGVAASLARGHLDGAGLLAPGLGFIAEGSLGYLWPQDSLGWNLRAGLAVTTLDVDRLSLTVQGSNVLGRNPGQTAWAGALQYTMSLWR